MQAKDSSSTTPETTASPPSPRPPSRRGPRGVAPPAFATPPSPPLVDEQHQPPPAVGEEPPLVDELGSSTEFGDHPDDEAIDRVKTTPGGPSPGSFNRRAIREAIAEGVRAATSRMNDLTRDDLLRENGVWLADERDADGIAKPLSGIITRRGGLDAVSNPDIGDAIAGGIALAVYAFKQLNLRAAVRRFRRAAAEPAYPPPADDAGETSDGAAA